MESNKRLARSNFTGLHDILGLCGAENGDGDDQARIHDIVESPSQALLKISNLRCHKS